MQFLNRIISRNHPSAYYSSASIISKYLSETNLKVLRNTRVNFSSESQNGGGKRNVNEGGNDQYNLPWDNTNISGNDGSFEWGDSSSSWSTGITKDHFDGEVVGRQVTPNADSGVKDSISEPRKAAKNDGLDRSMRKQLREMQREARFEASRDESSVLDEGWTDRDIETNVLLKQIVEPGARGCYLKDSEKSEMYRLHKESPEVYTIERLAKDYRIMRQRVAAILWLKELEEEEEKKLGEPLDDSVELLLDSFPE
ncbi:hypothetical protein RDABS01_014813 [Bienertia sinuspersici]